MLKYLLFLFSFTFLFSSPELKGRKKKNLLFIQKQKVLASWYGARFHGRKTASGEIFNMKKLTAAHKNLPFGTKLKVTNPKNGKTVTVIVNDRGPYYKNRVLDLSRQAFLKIANPKEGVIQVYIQMIK